MKGIRTALLAGVLPPLLVLLSGLEGVVAQQYGQTLRQQIVGTWTLVSVTNYRDGNQLPAFGSAPSGLAVFDAAGHFMQMLMRPDLPKIASNNRLTATAEENTAITRGSLAFFGTYTVGDGQAFTLHVVGSTFPNWTGSDQQRTGSVIGDELTITSPTPEVGGRTVIVYRRAK